MTEETRMTPLEQRRELNRRLDDARAARRLSRVGLVLSTIALVVMACIASGLFLNGPALQNHVDTWFIISCISAAAVLATFILYKTYNRRVKRIEAEFVTFSYITYPFGVDG